MCGVGLATVESLVRGGKDVWTEEGCRDDRVVVETRTLHDLRLS